MKSALRKEREIRERAFLKAAKEVALLVKKKIAKGDCVSDEWTVPDSAEGKFLNAHEKLVFAEHSETRFKRKGRGV